jgi:hypothetical protein
MDQPELPAIDLSPLGGRFAVKPALGGGGEGVSTEVTRFEQVRSERMKFPDQQYLLQAHVAPKPVDGLPAWFRVIYCMGEVHASFWDTETHVYTPLRDQTLADRLRVATMVIADVCCLELFSSEIALCDDECLRVVDYVNDPIDLRLQSAAVDGVPDEMVAQICRRIASTL